MSEDDKQTRAKLEMLNKHLDEVKRLQPHASTNAKPKGDAARAAIDFVSATTVGTLLGFGVDAWLHSSPWGLLGGLFLGTAAGVKHMLVSESQREAPKANDTNDTK